MQSRVVIQDNTTGIPRWLSFAQPVDIICANKLSEVPGCWRRIESGIKRGLYTVGFVSYEAASAFDSALLTHELQDFPYLWFAQYRQCVELNNLPEVTDSDYSLGDWRHSVSRQQYCDTISKIRRYICAGDSYQINYTHKIEARFFGNPWAFFVDLCHAQQARYSAYLNLGRYQILSVSPELFFQRDNGCLLSRPMKGTVARGLNTEEDAAKADWLRNSVKNRAENLMIVDMLRNDMGRIAEIGSVKVSSLFDIEPYPTLYQMTSSIEACTSASLTEIFSAMFPCASVTGAPKAKTMQLIKKFEPHARGVYTGSIGVIKPDGNAQFNVAIRTVLIDAERKLAQYGTGGGIVWDSDAASEYTECKTKAAVLRHPALDFDLLETILWQVNSGYYLLDYHLRRLSASAEYFDIAIDLNEIKKRLRELAATLNADTKVRLTVAAQNSINVQARDIESMHGKKVVLDTVKSNTQSVYCYHKTTRRGLYVNALRRHPDFADVILVNEQNRVTESTMANIVIERDGNLITPPRNHGLLAGVFREYWLTQGLIKEAEISETELLQSSRVWLINSVRGWMCLEQIADRVWCIGRHAMPAISAPD
jgi:para-aminobenzoate synthetase/4-amino-4-deoxychorismate lyase